MPYFHVSKWLHQSSTEHKTPFGNCTCRSVHGVLTCATCLSFLTWRYQITRNHSLKQKADYGIELLKPLFSFSAIVFLTIIRCHV